MRYDGQTMRMDPRVNRALRINNDVADIRRKTYVLWKSLVGMWTAVSLPRASRMIPENMMIPIVIVHVVHAMSRLSLKFITACIRDCEHDIAIIKFSRNMIGLLEIK